LEVSILQLGPVDNVTIKTYFPMAISLLAIRSADGLPATSERGSRTECDELATFIRQIILATPEKRVANPEFTEDVSIVAYQFEDCASCIHGVTRHISGLHLFVF
jgi:hypothetical protein